MVSTQFVVLALAAAATPTVFGYAKYLEQIPNGDALGKKVGHTDSGYTPFGTLFSQKGKTWAGVCKEKWPSSQVTVGAVLGDPCCKWTSGKADFELSEPFLAGKTCATAASSAPPAAAPTPAPAASTPAPAKVTPGPAAPTPAPGPAGPGQVLPAPIPTPAPASGSAGNTTVPGPAPTPAASGKGGKATGPTKICH